MNSLIAATGAVLPNLPNAWELSGRLVLAAFLGAIVGLEREVNDHPSGLRTHITVALGSALFGICSAYAWQDFIALRNDNNYQVDVTRVAAQIVSGVGFLGAGAIIKQGNTVRGLTSAAGLWVSAAIGLAVSVGMYVEAGVTTATLVVALVLLKRPRRWLRSRRLAVNESLVIVMSIDADPTEVISKLVSMPNAIIHSLQVKHQKSDGVQLIEADIEVRGGMLEAQLAPFEAREDVLSIDVS